MNKPEQKRGDGLRTDAERRRERARAANAALWRPNLPPQSRVSVANWCWPVDLSRYNRAAMLTETEAALLQSYVSAYERNPRTRTPAFDGALNRLTTPVSDVLEYARVRNAIRPWAIGYILRETARRGRSIWGWSRQEWIDVLNGRRFDPENLVVVAYLLCDFAELHRLGGRRIMYIVLARKIFGAAYILDLL